MSFLELIHSPLTFTFLTLGLYYSVRPFKKLHPQILAIAFIMLYLWFMGISAKEYQEKVLPLHLMLAPATVALAIPLYRKMALLKRYSLPLFVSLALGSLFAILSVKFFCWFFDLSPLITRSLLPKSVTTPIGLELSKQLQGLPSVTVLGIMVSGLSGASLAFWFFGFVGIKHPVAKGVGMGMAAHALGTARAIEESELIGAVSGVSYALGGLFTVLWISLLF